MSQDEGVTRIYNVPLTEALLVPRHRRAKRAMNTIRVFAMKHMKGKEVIIDPEINEKVWVKGIRAPPRRLTVKMVKDKEGVVRVSLTEE